MRTNFLHVLSFLTLPILLPVGASAATLTVGLASEPTSTDPHYHSFTPNNGLARSLYGALVTTDANQKTVPDLATAWSVEGDNVWTFNLRKGVKFSNGVPFTAKDVIFTFCRVRNNPQAISDYFGNPVTNFVKVETPDDHTVRITTKVPEPLLPERMAEMAILSAGIVKHGEIAFDLANGCGVTGEWPTLARFNSGEDAIGTGPFKLTKYTKGAGVELARNENYWGEKPAWEKVTLLPIPNAGPRLAGLLAGNYDLVENPAARDVKQLEGDPRFGVTIRPSNRVIFLQMDVSKDQSPSVVTQNGTNPFKDERVRRAISMAIDRDTIVKRIMDGAAAPASQFVPETMFGAQPNPEPLIYDPEGAKKLLAEAGYPNGFKVTFAATNDRYINDSQVAQAIAQYLSRVGIQADVDAMTASIFFTRRSKSEFVLSMGGWGSTTGGASSFLQQFVATLDKDRGVGRSNYGGWSDPAFDAVILKAIATVDETKRAELLREAGKLALQKLPDIPIHFESTIWAFRKGIQFEGRMDQYTLPALAKAVK